VTFYHDQHLSRGGMECRRSSPLFPFYRQPFHLLLAMSGPFEDELSLDWDFPPPVGHFPGWKLDNLGEVPTNYISHLRLEAERAPLLEENPAVVVSWLLKNDYCRFSWNNRVTPSWRSQACKSCSGSMAAFEICCGPHIGCRQPTLQVPGRAMDLFFLSTSLLPSTAVEPWWHDRTERR